VDVLLAMWIQTIHQSARSVVVIPLGLTNYSRISVLRSVLVATPHFRFTERSWKPVVAST
jgi:hypothetical protein